MKLYLLRKGAAIALCICKDDCKSSFDCIRHKTTCRTWYFTANQKHFCINSEGNIYSGLVKVSFLQPVNEDGTFITGFTCLSEDIAWL